MSVAIDEKLRRRKAESYYLKMQQAIWRMEDFHPEHAAKRIQRLALIGEDFPTWAERQRGIDGYVPAMKKRDADHREMGQREAWYEKTKHQTGGYIAALCALHDPRIIHTEAYRNFRHPYPDIPPPHLKPDPVDDSGSMT